MADNQRDGPKTMAEAGQLAFNLPHRTAMAREDFLVSASNTLAVTAIEGWQDWPQGRMALTGPARSGKTHLVHVWAGLSNAHIVQAATLRPADLGGDPLPALAVEDIDRIADLPPDEMMEAEQALFHLYNLAGEWRCPLLLTGALAPSAWTIGLPDLRSRLGAMSVVEISLPDDMLLSSLLVKLFSDRQLHVEPKVIDFIVRRMDRSFAAAEDLVARVDAQSLEQKHRVTTALVRRSTGWTR
ncbi:MAG: chromosomal replication initiator DnaA [Pseudomonadota bacterium]